MDTEGRLCAKLKTEIAQNTIRETRTFFMDLEFTLYVGKDTQDRPVIFVFDQLSDFPHLQLGFQNFIYISRTLNI